MCKPTSSTPRNAGQVIESRTVEILVGVFITALLQEDSELIRVHRFIAMHGADGEQREAKQSGRDHQAKKHRRGAEIHHRAFLLLHASSAKSPKSEAATVNARAQERCT